MNISYTYDDISLWDKRYWEGKSSPVDILTEWGLEHKWFLCKGLTGKTVNPEKMHPGTKTASPSQKTWIFPEEMDFWQEQQMKLIAEEGRENALCLLPEELIQGELSDPEVLLILRQTDPENPYWAMDAISQNRKLLEECSGRRTAVLFRIVSSTEKYLDQTSEFLSHKILKYHMTHPTLFLLAAFQKKAREHLKDIPGLEWKNQTGKTVSPDAAVTGYGEENVPVLDITRLWPDRKSKMISGMEIEDKRTMPFSRNRFIHSIMGRKSAASMRMEYQYESPDDSEFRKMLLQMGLRYMLHEKDHRVWVTIIPECAYEGSGKKYPCMLIQQEILAADPHSIVTALAQWFEYLEIAAMGELMLTFYAAGDPDDNEFLMDIIEDNIQKCEFFDRERIYITGHGEKGTMALEFAARHPGFIAGVAMMGNENGLGNPKKHFSPSDDRIRSLSMIDLPVININGQFENAYVHDFPEQSPNYLSREEKVRLWQNRLTASACPVQTAGTILMAQQSQEKAVRRVGVPGDRSEVLFSWGEECSVVDLDNRQGKSRLRMACIANLPHTIAPQMPWLTWNYLRQFRRDYFSGKIEEVIFD